MRLLRLQVDSINVHTGRHYPIIHNFVTQFCLAHRCPDLASNFATAEEAQDERHMVKIPDLTIEDAKIWHTRLIGFAVARDRKVAKAIVRQDSAVVRQAHFNKTLYDCLAALL